MNGGTGMHINIREHCADQAAVALTAFGAHVGQSLRMRFLIQAQVMTVGVDGRPSGLQLGPPIGHWHGEQFISACQRSEHLLLPLDVALLPAIPISVAMAAVLLTSRVENLCQHSEYIHGAHVDPAVDKGGHIGAGLFHIMRDSSATPIENQASVVQRLLTRGLRGHDGHQGSRRTLLVELAQFLQRKIRADIAVQNEEGSGIASSYLIPEVVHSTCSS